MKRPFYLVWNPTTGYTRYRHDNRALAEDESKRLALEHRGEEFIVLAPVSTSRTVEVQTELFDYKADDDIPF